MGYHTEITYRSPTARTVRDAYGWVEIDYETLGLQKAEKLQKEMDKYLCERDLVRRGG